MSHFLKFSTVLLFLTLNSFYVLSQTIQVFSFSDKQALISAYVKCKDFNSEKSKGFLTDLNGTVNLSSFSDSLEKIILQISYSGYLKISDTLNKNDNKSYFLLPDSLFLPEIVVTAQYSPDIADNSVHKIKVIDRKKIDAMGAQNLKDVLTNELNIRLAQDNILGSSMSVQGISGQNVKILIDGVPIIGRMNGNIDLSQINLNNTDHLEIIEGPLSVNYGTDALAGTINIITKKTQKNTFSISSNNYYESTGQFNTTGRIGFTKNKYTLAVSGGRNYFDGWRQTDNPFSYEFQPKADSTRFKDWKAKEQFFGTLLLSKSLNINKLNNSSLKLAYTGDVFYEQITNKGMPLLPYFETAFDDYYSTYRINNSLTLGGKLSEKYFTNIIASYNYFKRIKNTYYTDLTTINQTMTNNSGDQDTSVFSTFMSRGNISQTKTSTKLNIETGYDINYESATGLRIKDQKQEIGDYALFGTAEYTPNIRLTVKPGIRFIYNTSYTAPVVPSVNVKYKITPTGTLRFSYARGFRSPSLKELYFYFVDINHNIQGNTALVAETSNNFIASMSIGHSKKFQGFRSECSIFYNSINNMISLAQITSTQFSYLNIEKFESVGIQVSEEISFNPIKLVIGASLTGVNNHIGQSNTKSEFLYSPEIKTSFIYTISKINGSFAVFYKYTGETQAVSISETEEKIKTSISDYSIADISFSKSLYQKKINLGFGIRNLFNVTNITGNAISGPHTSAQSNVQIGMGRSFFFKLDFNLNCKQ
jgi:outer membrane receptor for ferrienterochelin and colicins